MIEIGDVVSVERRTGMKEQSFDAVFEFLMWLSESMKLILCIVGALTLVQKFLCQRRAKSIRSVGTQSQCTYTSLRKVLNPRFQPLDDFQQGAFVD